MYGKVKSGRTSDNCGQDSSNMNRIPTIASPSSVNATDDRAKRRHVPCLRHDVHV